MPEIKIKRVYESPSLEDGQRILIDRLWPRGLKKEQAPIDFWMCDTAPSEALRKWFGHNPEKWEEFRRRYFAELDRNSQLIEKLLEKAAHHPITLLYAARDEKFNNARALKIDLETRYGKTQQNGVSNRNNVLGANHEYKR